MKTKLLTIGIMSMSLALFAQVKNDLSDVPNLLTEKKVINAADAFDLFTNNEHTFMGDFTVEVKAKVTSADQRGLDVEAKTATGKGFRVVTTPTQIINQPLTRESTVLKDALDNAATSNSFRYVVKNNKLDLYRNNLLVNTQPLDIQLLGNLNMISKNNSEFNEGNFESGMFGGWTDPGVGATVAVVDKPVTSPETEQESKRCLQVFYGSGLNSVDVVSIFVMGVEPNSTYELNYKYLPYLKNQPASGGYNIKVGVYNDPSTTSAMGANIHNGYQGNTTSTVDPKWNNASPIRFVTNESMEYVIIRIIAINNPCRIYFDDFVVTKTEYPTEYPAFKSIPANEADSKVDKTGIYNPINLLADRNPGFENSQNTTNPNANNAGAVLPTDSTMWFSNQSVGGGTGGARVLTDSKGGTEGTKCYLGRFESSYTYFGYKLPTLKPKTAYKASFDLVSAKTPSNGKRFYLSVSTTKSASGTGNVILNSKVAQLGSTLYVGTDTAKYEVRRPEIAFITPDTVPATGLYMNWNILDTGDFLFNVDRMTLVEQEDVVFEPKGTLKIGKNFFSGSADMEIESIKIVDSAVSPVDETALAKNYDTFKSISFNNGQLYISGLSNEKLSIVDIAGREVFSTFVYNSTESISLKLNKGVYLAKTATKTAKFFVK